MPRSPMVLCGALLGACHDGFLPMAATASAVGDDGSPAEILIADAGGFPACRARNDGGVYRVGLDGAALWTLGAGSAIRGPHTAELSADGRELLVSDTCNDRVVVYAHPSGRLRWDSAEDCPELTFAHPNSASFSGAGLADTLLLTSLTDHRVIALDPARCGNGVDGDEVAWEFDGDLRFPHSAARVPGLGHILIVDSGAPLAEAARVIEVDPESGAVVWAYSAAHCGGDGCPGLSWARSAKLACGDSGCRTGSVLITDRDETVRVERDLDAWPSAQPPEITLHQRHGEGYTYGASWLPSWEGDDSGWLLISHHGTRREHGWVRVVSASAADSSEPVWELRAPP